MNYLDKSVKLRELVLTLLRLKKKYKSRRHLRISGGKILRQAFVVSRYVVVLHASDSKVSEESTASVFIIEGGSRFL
jgi:hypothetical protein